MATRQKYTQLLSNAKQRLEEVKRLQSLGLICRDGEFVPSVHYPPITQYPTMKEEEAFLGYTMPEDGLLDIYVHFPFCERRCTFCHYPGKLGEQYEEKERYLVALEKEMKIYMQRLGINKIKARSILIGGGTPTYLTPKQLNQFLDFFCEKVDLSTCKQFNYDVDPVTLLGEQGDERLRIMKEHGVNRLTIGVQSLDDSVLKLMNRNHNAQTAIASIENSRKYGFQLNIEFIYGHPGETLENWVEVMEKAVTLPVDEIQLYRLKVLAYGDLQGNIYNYREENPTHMLSFDETMMMKQMAVDILSDNGFHENLRRVYTKEKKYFSHYAYNQCCKLYDQIGFGLTAFSSLRDRFTLNTQSLEEYYSSIEQGRLPLNRGYVRNQEDQARWAMVLPLKNSEVKKSYYEKVTKIPFDQVFKTKINRLVEYGLLTNTDHSLSLTELGSFIADEVVEQFNANEFIPFPPKAYEDGPLNPYRDNLTQEALGLDEYSKEVAASDSACLNLSCDKDWDVVNMSDNELEELLTAKGEQQQELFKQARSLRQENHGNKIRLRGVIEISNICQKNCDYCAMRRGNNTLDRFRMDVASIMEVATQIVNSGIHIVFLQAGQDPHCDAILEEVIPRITNELGAQVLLCVGEREEETYRHFYELGAKSFILKYETSNRVMHEQITHAKLDKRMQCMQWIKKAGMELGTGNITGIPQQTIEDIISDIRLAFSLQPDFVSTAPFIPNACTPFQDSDFGDINLTLNTMAILRIGLKDALIPTVSALESLQTDGQLMGLNAGANVMTINFTPGKYRENYKIYSKNRYIVKLEHALKTAERAGLQVEL